MWAKIQGWFSKIAAFLNQNEAGIMIKKSIALMLEEAGPVALDILFGEALRLAKLQNVNTDLAGVMKADNVRKALTQFAEKQGLTIAKGTINKAIEVAVDQLRK